MSTARTDDFKELVRSRTDLLILIGESVALQARGHGQFVGLCPFHDDHSPSMTVYPDRHSFRCWACNTGGDCFEFVMRRESVTFFEALEILATRAHLEMPKAKRVGPQDNQLSKPRLYEVLEWAETQFHEFLLKSPEAAEARDYIAQRRLAPETVKQFRLGYAPDRWDWLLGLARGKYSYEQLAAAGVIQLRLQGSGYHDFFVDRVMFPIRDCQKHVVGFGGRALPGHANAEKGKYRNSPDTVLFQKSGVLYGLDAAREGIRKTDAVVVFEGYTDCIMAHQAGITNCVATLGTALTETNVSNLKRLTRKVFLVYDGDKAGRDATEKSLPRFLSQSVDLRILTLPGDLDPADALLEHGAEWFSGHLGRAPEVWDYKFNSVVARHGLDSTDNRQRVLEEMLETLSQVPTNSMAGFWQVREDLMLGRLSQRLGVPETRLRQTLADLRRQRAQGAAKTVAAPTSLQSQESAAEVQRLIARPTKDEKIECELLEILLVNPETLGSICPEIAPAEITHPLLRTVLELCYRFAAEQRPFAAERLMVEIEDQQLKNLATFLAEQGHKKRVGPEVLQQHTLPYFQHRRGLPPQLPTLKFDGGDPGTRPPHEGDPKELLRRAAEINLRRQRI